MSLGVGNRNIPVLLQEIRSNFTNASNIVWKAKISRIVHFDYFEEAKVLGSIKVSRVRLDLVGLEILPRLRDDIFSLLISLGPESVFNTLLNPSQNDDELREAECFLRSLREVSHRFLNQLVRADDGFDSLVNPKQLPSSEEDMMQLVLLSYNKFDSLVGWIECVIYSLQRLIDDLCSYLEKLQHTTHTTVISFPFYDWGQIARDSSKIFIYLDESIKTFSQSEYKLFLRRSSSSADFIEEYCSKPLEIYLRRVLQTFGPNPSQLEQMISPLLYNYDSDSDDSDYFYNHHRNQLPAPPRFCFGLFLKLLSLLQLFINKVSRENHQRLKLNYSLTLDRMITVSCEFKKWDNLSYAIIETALDTEIEQSYLLDYINVLRKSIHKVVDSYFLKTENHKHMYNFSGEEYDEQDDRPYVSDEEIEEEVVYQHKQLQLRTILRFLIIFTKRQMKQFVK
ncbi:expressed protein [Phakopsora pachyrhizi]|uniref:Expressed protein n=1 Tax=Phakopsora pachyrhizi TaxID=170000 RepID=A0AAV0AF76_PHAPC|nr:expressed protein [Phakopsora pachyrhizi]